MKHPPAGGQDGLVSSAAVPRPAPPRRAPPLPAAPPEGPLTVAEALAAVACLVPPGRAVSYGALARILGRGGARLAGRAMAEADPGTPWWRVVRADGSLPEDLAARAAPERDREGTPLRPAAGGLPRVDLARAAWDPHDDGDGPVLAAIADLAARVDHGRGSIRPASGRTP